MGQPDLYPFVLTPATIEKLRFVHGLFRPADGFSGRSGTLALTAP
jgi:hypothetical protein